jgi:hypothetical protein
LAWLAMDALPGQPLSKEAGASCSGIYKQKQFHTLLERHSALHDRVVQLRRMAANDHAAGSTAASASIAQDLALPLALCAMAAQLPLPALLMHTEALLPIVVSALQVAATPPAAQSTALSADASFSSDGDMEQDVIAAVTCLRLLTRHTDSIVANRLHTLVPLLLRISQFNTTRHSMALRVAAVDALRGFTALPYPKLHPLRSVVIKGLTPCLDDPKRKVRQHAVACRNDYAVLGT